MKVPIDGLVVSRLIRNELQMGKLQTIAACALRGAEAMVSLAARDTWLPSVYLPRAAAGMTEAKPGQLAERLLETTPGHFENLCTLVDCRLEGGKVAYDTQNLRLNGNASQHGSTPQQLLVEVPAAFRGKRLANVELTHGQVLSEKTLPWNGSKTQRDQSAAYSQVEFFVTGKGWTNLGQAKKFPEARSEIERLHDLPDAGGEVLAVRVKNVGVDPVHVRRIALQFLPEKPQIFDETVFTPGTAFGDPWQSVPPSVNRVRSPQVEGTRYPSGITMNNSGDWAPTAPVTLERINSKGWSVDQNSLFIPLEPGQRFRTVEVAIGDTHPDPNLNSDHSYGRKGWAKLNVSIERPQGTPIVLTRAENIPPQGVLTASSDHLIRPGDRLKIDVSADAAGLMGIRIGYDSKTFTLLDRPAGGSQGGRWFQDESGQVYFGKNNRGNEIRVAAEALAGELYELMGARVPDRILTRIDGKVTLMSRAVAGRQTRSPAEIAATDAKSAFPIDAWLANWDVFGSDFSNIIEGDDGHAYRIDLGGSLYWRARGAHKDLPQEVTELRTLRDPRHSGGQVLAGITGITDAEATDLLSGFAKRYFQVAALIDLAIDNSWLPAEVKATLKRDLAARANWMSTTGLAELEALAPANPALLAQVPGGRK